MTAFKMPVQIHRQVRVVGQNSLTTYEVMAEMTAMWKQACQAGKELVDQSDLMTEPTAHMLSQLATAVGKREAWEQAIMVYTGWNGTQVEAYLAEVKQDA